MILQPWLVGGDRALIYRNFQDNSVRLFLVDAAQATRRPFALAIIVISVTIRERRRILARQRHARVHSYAFAGRPGGLRPVQRCGSTMATIHGLAGVPLMRSSCLRQLATVIIAAHNSQASCRQSRWQPPSHDCEALSVYFHTRRASRTVSLLVACDSKWVSSRGPPPSLFLALLIPVLVRSIKIDEPERLGAGTATYLERSQLLDWKTNYEKMKFFPFFRKIYGISRKIKKLCIKKQLLYRIIIYSKIFIHFCIKERVKM